MKIIFRKYNKLSTICTTKMIIEHWPDNDHDNESVADPEKNLGGRYMFYRKIYVILVLLCMYMIFQQNTNAILSN